VLSDDVSENSVRDSRNVVSTKKRMCEMKCMWIPSGLVREKTKTEVWMEEG
jgi:hypothetical protein